MKNNSNSLSYTQIPWYQTKKPWVLIHVSLFLINIILYSGLLNKSLEITTFIKTFIISSGTGFYAYIFDIFDLKSVYLYVVFLLPISLSLVYMSYKKDSYLFWKILLLIHLLSSTLIASALLFLFQSY